jgi:hypothetical protein
MEKTMTTFGLGAAFMAGFSLELPIQALPKY